MRQTFSSLAMRVRSYLDLAKVDVPELWLGVPVAWSLLPEATWFAGRTIALFLVFLLSVVCITAAAQALDDVQGARDGTDDTNYAPDKLRRRSRKPLIEGRLTQRQAILFAKITTLVGVGGVFAAWLVADLTPLWFPLATGASIALAVQYSYGMSFSYRIFAGGEVVLAVTTASTVILAYALVAGTVSVAALACGWLLGMGILQVSVCSSTNDAPGDRQANRKTVAATVSYQANRRMVYVLVSQSILLLLVLPAIGVLSWQLWMLALPTAALQVLQLRAIHGDDWLLARRRGFLALRTLGIALVAASVVGQWR